MMSLETILERRILNIRAVFRIKLTEMTCLYEYLLSVVYLLEVIIK